MNFISALFHKRTITKAFNAVDNDNVAELEALKIDPNTTRKAVLEKYTFEWGRAFCRVLFAMKNTMWPNTC